MYIQFITYAIHIPYMKGVTAVNISEKKLMTVLKCNNSSIKKNTYVDASIIFFKDI